MDARTIPRTSRSAAGRLTLKCVQRAQRRKHAPRDKQCDPAPIDQTIHRNPPETQHETDVWCLVVSIPWTVIRIIAAFLPRLREPGIVFPAQKNCQLILPAAPDPSCLGLLPWPLKNRTMVFLGAGNPEEGRYMGVALIAWGRFLDGRGNRVTVPAPSTDPGAVWLLDFLARHAFALRRAGFTAIQLPPTSKAQGGAGAGCDGYGVYRSTRSRKQKPARQPSHALRAERRVDPLRRGCPCLRLGRLFGSRHAPARWRERRARRIPLSRR